MSSLATIRGILAGAVVVCGWVTAASGSSYDALAPKDLSGGEQAFYSVSLNGVPLGVAVAVQDDEEAPGPVKFDMKLLIRVGANPLVAHFEWELKMQSGKPVIEAASHYEWKKDGLSSYSGTWTQDGASLVSTGQPRADLANILLGEASEIKNASLPWTKETSLFLFKPEKISKEDVKLISPFSSLAFSPTDAKAKFDKDGFAKSVSLPVSQDFALVFKRIESDEVKGIIEKALHLPVDPQWFSSQANAKDDFDALRKRVGECLAFDERAEREIKRRTPNLPYLLHRKLVNLSSLCRLLDSTLMKARVESWSAETTMERLAERAKVMEKEARRELPVSISMSPEWSVLSRDELKWQCARVLRFLLARAQSEVESLLAIEQERKVDAFLSVRTSKQELRAVLRGTLKAKDAAFRVLVETVEDGGKLPTSPGQRVSGLEFAQARVSNEQLSAICGSGGGDVSLDLADPQVLLLRSENVRGVWDLSTRIVMIPEFLQTAAAIPNCRRVTVFVQKSAGKDAIAALQHFLHDVLQVENEMQISNGREKKIRIIPGNYELSLSSFVNGAQLGRRDFSVEDQMRGRTRIVLKFD